MLKFVFKFIHNSILNYFEKRNLRSLDEKLNQLEEEILGFVMLEEFDVKSIGVSVEDFVSNLDPDNPVGLRYGECFTISEKEEGVQTKVQKTLLWFLHKLNLVNDLNVIPEIQNCFGTIRHHHICFDSPFYDGSLFLTL